jgi:CelD/BcsL family acetyltransferase involved in cellulose biosynthesis
MNVSVISPHELGASEIDAWRAMQRSTPALENPFLSPGFTLAAARIRPETRVAVLEDARQILGFFPFERTRHRIARPVAPGVSDRQGIVHVPSFEPDPVELLHKCNVDVWEFDHLLAAQIPAGQPSVRRRDSPIIDVSRGYETYAQQQRMRSKRTFSLTEYKQRKLGRDFGSVRLEFDAHDPQALRLLLRWKSAQYRRTGRRDRFAVGWIERLVWDLFERDHRGCNGTLTVLYVAERVVAAHFGLMSENSLSCWFPAYDLSLGKYSPGLVMFLMMADAAARADLHHLDLGKGDEPYKQSLKTGELAVAEGAAYRPSVAAVAHGVRRMPVRYVSDFVLSHGRLRRLARTTLARVGRMRSPA